MRLPSPAAVVLGLLLPQMAAHPARAQEAAPEIGRLSWLAGCWNQVRPDGLIEEQWMKPLGGSMLGMSRTVAGGRTREFEFIRIMTLNGVLAYIARPSGQDEAAFPLKTLEDGLVVFENPGHDFPQRVIYRRHAGGSITARIEGTIDGAARGRDFPYTRCEG
jgi:hypothetical protein